MNSQGALAKQEKTLIQYNIPYADLSRPMVGPINPFKPTEGNSLKRKNVLTGYAEEVGVSDFTFRTQHRTFQSKGYAADPSANGQIIGDMTNAGRFLGRDVVQMKPSKEASEAFRRKRQRKGDPSIVEGEGAYRGPWARYETEQASENEVASAGEEGELAGDFDEPPTPTKASPMATAYKDDVFNAETTQFHGSELYDYQGRSYMHVPQDLDINLRKEPGNERNYHPKKQIFKWKFGRDPITALRFFPNSGHLLLSASADAKIKIYSVYNERELLRSYTGHKRSVSDISFNESGTSFLSGSYDRKMVLWDTETGKAISTYTPENGSHLTWKIPHVLKFHPDESSHEFLAGMSDNRIVQFDTRSGEMTQEYNHHLASVNTITFVDSNRRMITSSDDKSILAWEIGIPVPIKRIAEPHMYSLVRAASHPSGKAVAFQSLDNQIVVYASTDRFRQNRKKIFKGHNCAGYGIDVTLSPDGQFVMTGDTGGFVCFYDWKTTKMLHKIMAGENHQPVTCAQWHPQETSKVVTAGIDGVIKYWD